MMYKSRVSYRKSSSLKLGPDDSLFEENVETEKQSFTVFDNQAGGHSTIFTVEDQKLAKPCNPQEANFYQHIHTEPLLEPLVPKYWEIRHIDYINEDNRRYFQTQGEFLILENLTAAISHPCVMDLKLGNINYDPSRHKPDKIRLRKLRLESTTAGKLGVRLSGLRVFRPRYDNYLICTSKYTYHLHTEWHLKRAIKLFLHDGYRLRTELIPMFIQRLKQLLRALKSQTTFDFLSSSVLFIYEGDLQTVKETKTAKLSPVDVRLIDFDHASIRPHPITEDSNGTTLGISALINLMKKILFSAKKTISDSKLQTNFKNSLSGVTKSPKGSHSEEEE